MASFFFWRNGCGSGKLIRLFSARWMIRFRFVNIFLFPYLLWFVFLIGIQIYTLLYDTESFIKFMKFIMVSYSLAVIIYMLFPNCQELRPVVFERDNLFTKFLEGFYQFDTNTNVCPSIHVIGSVAVMICGWNCKSLNTPGWRIFLGFFRIFDFHIHRFFKAALGIGYFCGNPGLHCRIPRRIRERQEKRKEHTQ